MAGMSKNEKFQLELLRKLIANKPCYKAVMRTPTQEYSNLYGWGEVFRAVDPRGFFVAAAPANPWKELEIIRNRDCGIVIRNPEGDFEIKAGRGKKVIACFSCPEFNVYIDAKNLEFFEDDLIFLAKNAYDMVLLWKGENLIGGIMPFVAKK